MLEQRCSVMLAQRQESVHVSVIVTIVTDNCQQETHTCFFTVFVCFLPVKTSCTFALWHLNATFVFILVQLCGVASSILHGLPFRCAAEQ